MQSESARVTVRVTRLSDMQQLAQRWATLAARASNKKNPFLSWSWIAHSLDHNDIVKYVIEACYNEQIVGLGVLCHTVSDPEHYFLNRTGVPEYDQIWSEYNDFLLDQQYQRQARAALIEYCVNQLSWQSFTLGASDRSAIAPFTLFGLDYSVLWHSHSYNLQCHEYPNGNVYLNSLSRNTRYQIRRSIKAYEQLGELTLHLAENQNQALEWFEQAAPHHIARWQNTNVGSGFTNSHFKQFHRALISELFANGEIEVLKVTAGNEVVTYLYNLIKDKHVYFYLSANVYNQDLHHAKPGLVGHYLAITHYIEKGFASYDFMGGESQYKRSLSTSNFPIGVYRFTRAKPWSKLKHTLRRLKYQFYSPKYELTQALPKVIVTGGKAAPKGSVKNFDSASCKRLTLNLDGSLQVDNHYTVSQQQTSSAASCDIIFKAAGEQNGLLYLPCETEIHILNAQTLVCEQVISKPTFNDLHHVQPHNNKLYITNTGLDAIQVYYPQTQHTELMPCVLNTTQRPLLHQHDSKDDKDDMAEHADQVIDYRLVASTKPHLAHPNFCFILNGEPWVTRCDFMDAVNLNNLQQRIFIGDGLIHDGVIHNNHIYFTTVNGYVKVFDTDTLKQVADVNIRLFAPHINGWFRGILPLGGGKALIGVTQTRASKRNITRGNKTLLILFDLYQNSLLQKWTLSDIGINAVFSILKAEEL